jgi:hypothetical protein
MTTWTIIVCSFIAGSWAYRTAFGCNRSAYLTKSQNKVKVKYWRDKYYKLRDDYNELKKDLT